MFVSVWPVWPQLADLSVTDPGAKHAACSTADVWPEWSLQAPTWLAWDYRQSTVQLSNHYQLVLCEQIAFHELKATS